MENAEMRTTSILFSIISTLKRRERDQYQQTSYHIVVARAGAMITVAVVHQERLKNGYCSHCLCEVRGEKRDPTPPPTHGREDKRGEGN